MNKLRNKVNLDNSLTFTRSSFSYQDPYQVDGGLLYKMINKARSFIAMRSIENEFVDFKTYNVQRQFKEINTNIYHGFSKRDKVRLQKSLSESMFDYAKALHKDKSKINPFVKDISSFKIMQARVYSENDHLLPEEQWAQITVRLNGKNVENKIVSKYTVFERRVADKLDQFDWKMSFLADEEDFRFINDRKL